jgi:hypothetical protein
VKKDSAAEVKGILGELSENSKRFWLFCFFYENRLLILRLRFWVCPERVLGMDGT